MGSGPHPGRPFQEALRGPVADGPVVGRHVLGEGGVTAGSGNFLVADHAGEAVEDFHDILRNADPDLLMDQGIGHGVKMAVHLDRVVDMNLGFLPAGQLVAGSGKRAEGRFLLTHKEIQPRPAPAPLEGPTVQIDQKGPDCPVEVRDLEEDALSESGQDPARHELHPFFYGGLVCRASDAGRKDRGGIMLRHLPIGFVEERLIKIGGGDPAFEVVGDQKGGNAPKKLEAADMRVNPTRQILAGRGFGKDVVREPQDGDKDLGLLSHLSCVGILDRHTGPGVVDEETVPRRVGVPVRGLQALFPGGIMLAGAGIGLSPLLAGLPVLFPEEQKRDPLVALKFPMDLLPIRHNPGRGVRISPLR